MVARIGSELVANSRPGRIVDQRRMQTGIEFALVRNPAGVDRIREQPIDMPAREGSAAALGATPLLVHFVLNPRRSASSLTRRTQPSSRYNAKMRRTVSASAGLMMSVRSRAS